MGGFLFFFNSVILNFLIPTVVITDIYLSFCFDYIRRFFFSCISFIRAMVFLYSNYYINIDSKNITSDQIRFLIILFFFVSSMFFLVFSFSWFLVILGWDGLGVVSFLLVIFYNDRKRIDSGIITFLTNRVGDCFFLLSFIFMFCCGYYSFEYLNNTSFIFFFFIVVVGVITKRAQIPFSSWLPAAMAAPTPVSSLVHSSTLVTAGVFLLIRFNYLLEMVGTILIVVSLMTIMFAGIFALYELDFKKVVAMSTLSQLGFMVFSISLGGWLLGFLHIMFHAFFKRSLFLSTGSLIHFLIGNQDSRDFGGFFISFFSKLFFSSRCLSLIGFPFSLGFYSKDFILGGLLFSNSRSITSYIFVLSCCFTVAYRIRLIMIRFSKYSCFYPIVEFGEIKNFYLPVLFLFFIRVLVGDFFLFYFIPLNFVFSFVELFVGILVIVSGLVMYLTLSKIYYLNFVFSSIMFMPLLNSILGLLSIRKVPCDNDITWNEIFIAKGVKEFFYVSKTIIKSFYLSSFVFFGVFFYIIVMFIYAFSLTGISFEGAKVLWALKRKT